MKYSHCGDSNRIYDEPDENENENILKPKWLGTEVTNDERYYNSYLSQNPFKNW